MQLAQACQQASPRPVQAATCLPCWQRSLPAAALRLPHQHHATVPRSQPGCACSSSRRPVRAAAAGPVAGVADSVPSVPDHLSSLKLFLTAVPQMLGSNPLAWFWVLGPVVLGSLTGATGTFTGGYTWYRSLRKPWFTLPEPVFGIAWSGLYLLMGLAAYRVYDKAGWPSWALQVYLAQLALNLLWYVIFFDAKKPRAAQLENAVFFVLVCYTTWLFLQVDTTAGYLMFPYVAWVAFANLLNLSIVKKN